MQELEPGSSLLVGLVHWVVSVSAFLYWCSCRCWYGGVLPVQQLVNIGDCHEVGSSQAFSLHLRVPDVVQHGVEHGLLHEGHGGPQSWLEQILARLQPVAMPRSHALKALTI